MDCKDAEKLINKLLSSSSSEKGFNDNEILLLEEHTKNCSSCASKWNLDSAITKKLVEQFDSINPSDILKAKIDKKINKSKNFASKKTLIAACLVIFLGLGLFIERAILKPPDIYELHNLDNFNVVSNDIEHLSNYAGIQLNKDHLRHFDTKGYMLHGISIVSSPFTEDIKLVALKAKDGHRISICFLPRSYKLTYHTKGKVKDTHIYHGNINSHHFIFWKGNTHKIVLVSRNNMSHDELTELAYPFIGEI